MSCDHPSVNEWQLVGFCSVLAAVLILFALLFWFVVVVVSGFVLTLRIYFVEKYLLNRLKCYR